MGAWRIVAVAFLAFSPGFRPGAGVSTPFCPGCWRYVESRSDGAGHAITLDCLIPPVDLETCTWTWFWCRRLGRWGRSPCEEDAWSRCCRERSSLALIASPGLDGPVALRYCPQCLRIEKAGCRGCGRPPVLADAVRRTWFRCAKGGGWREAPCPGDGVEGCCSPRTGMLLACLRHALPFGPIALSVAGGG